MRDALDEFAKAFFSGYFYGYRKDRPREQWPKRGTPEYDALADAAVKDFEAMLEGESHG